MQKDRIFKQFEKILMETNTIKEYEFNKINFKRLSKQGAYSRLRELAIDKLDNIIDNDRYTREEQLYNMLWYLKGKRMEEKMEKEMFSAVLLSVILCMYNVFANTDDIQKLLYNYNGENMFISFGMVFFPLYLVLYIYKKSVGDSLGVRYYEFYINLIEEYISKIECNT